MNAQQAINWSQKSSKNKEQDDSKVLSLGDWTKTSVICQYKDFNKWS